MTTVEFSNTFEKKPENITKELETFLKKVSSKSSYIIEDQLTPKGIELLALNQKGVNALKYRVWFYETDRSTNIWEELKKSAGSVNVEGRDELKKTIKELEFAKEKTETKLTKRLKAYIAVTDKLDVSSEEADSLIISEIERLVNSGIVPQFTFNIIKDKLLKTYNLKQTKLS